ncbi:MAG TPA: DinB family protein [Mycobacteriales bacterium]|nr:DinB family protein [Mycobacteriales bacterium]
MTANRRRPPGLADEREMLTGWLDWQRATVRHKCRGLSEVDAHRQLLPESPTMTVAGLVTHLRWTEHGWFEVSFLGAPNRAPTDPDDRHAAWRPGAASLEELLDAYDRQCARSREIVAAHELDTPEAYVPPGLERVGLRWIVGHMIEETARHLGHLDALRELADGVTGS